jgi:hypothetical protein
MLMHGTPPSIRPDDPRERATAPTPSFRRSLTMAEMIYCAVAQHRIVAHLLIGISSNWWVDCSRWSSFLSDPLLRVLHTATRREQQWSRSGISVAQPSLARMLRGRNRTSARAQLCSSMPFALRISVLYACIAQQKDLLLHCYVHTSLRYQG